MEMDENIAAEPQTSGSLPKREPDAATPSLLGKFSIKSFFGMTTKLDNKTPKEERAVLKSFRPLEDKVEVQASPPNSDEGESIPEQNMQQVTVQEGNMELKEEPVKDEQISEKEHSGVDLGITSVVDLHREEHDVDLHQEEEDVDSQVTRGQGKSDVSQEENKDHPQIDHLGGTEAQVLQEQKDEKEGVYTKRLNGADIGEDAKSDLHSSTDIVPDETDYDKEDLLVHGTLVHISSDSDSDTESSKPNICQGATKAPVSPHLSASNVSLNNGSKQEPETQGIDDTDAIETKKQDGLDFKKPESLCPNMDENANTTKELEESSPSTPATTPAQDTPGEKPFQLPTFFSSFRVHKKGTPAEDRETVTVKQGDSDLALLNLSQPVQKSNLSNVSPVRKREVKTPVETKASSKFMEQLSQLLNFDVPKQEEEEDEVPEEIEEAPKDTVGKEIKSESALEAFKSFFTGAPKKPLPAEDSLDLEAVKRKQKSDKESLKSIFEKGRPIENDQNAERKSVCDFFFFLLLRFFQMLMWP